MRYATRVETRNVGMQGDLGDFKLLDHVELALTDAVAVEDEVLGLVLPVAGEELHEQLLHDALQILQAQSNI